MTTKKSKTTKTTKPIKAWHWLPNDGKLANGDGRQVVAGETYTVWGTIALCSHGLHASRKLMHALGYVPGNILCRVECSGDVVEGDDKLVCTKRKVVWMFDAGPTMVQFAAECAERAKMIAEAAANGKGGEYSEAQEMAWQEKRLVKLVTAAYKASKGKP